MMNNKSITTVNATININNPEYKIRRNSNYLFIDNNVINIDNMKEILGKRPVVHPSMFRPDIGMDFSYRNYVDTIMIYFMNYTIELSADSIKFYLDRIVTYNITSKPKCIITWNNELYIGNDGIPNIILNGETGRLFQSGPSDLRHIFTYNGYLYFCHHVLNNNCILRYVGNGENEFYFFTSFNICHMINEEYYVILRDDGDFCILSIGSGDILPPFHKSRNAKYLSTTSEDNNPLILTESLETDKVTVTVFFFNNSSVSQTIISKSNEF